MNLIILAGHICSELEFKERQFTDILSFSLLIEEPYIDKNGNEAIKREYINCGLYGGRAKYWGDKLFIEGSIKTMKYNSKGEDRFYTYVYVNKIMPEFHKKLSSTYEDKLFNSPIKIEEEELPF
jgi:single-stranded DNA-binding protein